MSEEFKVEVLTPARELVTTTASEVLLPTYIGEVGSGEIGILPQHEDICGLLSTGTLKIVTHNKDFWFMVSGGAYRVENGVLTVLAEYALGAETINAETTLAKLKEVEFELSMNLNTLDDKTITLAAEKNRLLASIEANRRHSMS